MVKEVPCISLYMPTHRSHPDNVQDAIRYKNLVRNVKESLVEKYPDSDVPSLLEPFEALAGDRAFWNHTSDGLAVLRSPGIFEVIRMQMPVGQRVILSDSFHTRPLTHFLQFADRFHVVALAMDTLQFFEGNQYSLSEVELPGDFPKTINIALGEAWAEKRSSASFYGGVTRVSPNRTHGQGGKIDEMNSDVLQFFRVAGSAIYERYSKPTGLPLILVAAREHHHRFYQTNKNPFLLPKGIEINPQAISIEKLAELSWEVMKPLYLEKLDSLVKKFEEARANGLGSDKMDESVKAAEAGRVETLLIEAHRVVADRSTNSAGGTVETADLTQPILDDQLDDVNELVLKTGGTVITIPRGQMPSDTGLAAIFRWPSGF